MPARTLNDFLAGFFYGQARKDSGADMRTPLQNDRKKSNRKQGARRKTNVEMKRTEGERDRGQEVTVRHKPAPPRKEKSTFSWFEEITVEWSETFLSKS
jgi:hypothetical protein